ncbi:hypothetical protein ABVT39_005633 [Epinephelus coioides]
MEMEIGHTLQLLEVSSFFSCSVLKDISVNELRGEHRGREQKQKECVTQMQRGKQNRHSEVGRRTANQQLLVKPSCVSCRSETCCVSSTSLYTAQICCIGFIPLSGMWLTGAKENNYLSLWADVEHKCLAELAAQFQMLIIVYLFLRWYDWNQAWECSQCTHVATVGSDL